MTWAPNSDRGGGGGGGDAAFTAVSLALRPAAGTPTSVANTAVLDAGLLDTWIVGSNAGRFVSGVDDGTTQDFVLNAGVGGNEDWGQAIGPYGRDGSYLYHPDLFAGPIDFDWAFEITANGGNWSAGVALLNAGVDTSYVYDNYCYAGFGKLGTVPPHILVNPRCSVYGYKGGNDSDTDPNIATGAGVVIRSRIQIDAAGVASFYYKPSGAGSWTQFAAPSGGYRAQVGGVYRIAVVMYANSGSGETFKVSEVNVEGHSVVQ